jgi:hypothetical protein
MRNSLQSWPTISRCSKTIWLGAHTSNPDTAKPRWPGRPNAPLSSNIKTYPPFWTNLACRGFPAIYVTKTRSSTPSTDTYPTTPPSSNVYRLRRPQPPPPPSSVFVDAPIPIAADPTIPDRLRHLVRKFDPVERDYRNRALGKAGERFVLALERRGLTEADRSDLAKRIRSGGRR